MKLTNLCMLAIIFLVLGCEKDKEPYSQPLNLKQAVENIIQPMVNDKTTVGAAIGIIKPGGEQEMYFFGEKTKKQGDRPDENTLFEIGSISKTMTAAILADMVLACEVNLEDAVEDHLPGIDHFPDYNGNKIAFKHLANHTSSLPRLPSNLLGNDPGQYYAQYSKKHLYHFMDGYILARPIGSEEEYSNLAFGLLGHTLGEIKSTSFETLLNDIVFDRLGMTNSHTIIPADNNNVAQPYNKQRRAIPAWNFSEVMLGAGGVKSSLKDMLTFLEANLGYGDSDLKDALLLSHQNTQTLHNPDGTGLAWVNGFNAEKNSTLTAHNGGTAGSVAFIGFIKEWDVGVVLLFNTDIINRTGRMGIETQKAVAIIEAIRKY